MFRFVRRYRHGLRNKVFSVLAVVIRPTVHFRNFARPVTMSRMNRGGPFQRSGIPRVGSGQLPAFEDAIEEVEHEQQLRSKYNQHHNTDELVQLYKLFERLPVGVVEIPSGHTSHTFVVHRPEDAISAHQGDPEVDEAQGAVHITAVQFREPVIDTGKHTEECRYTHYYMEVRDHKVSIVQVNVDRRVTQPDTGQTTRDKGAHETDSEQGSRRKTDITFPDRGQPVKHLNSRWHGDQQR